MSQELRLPILARHVCEVPFMIVLGFAYFVQSTAQYFSMRHFQVSLISAVGRCNINLSVDEVRCI